MQSEPLPRRSRRRPAGVTIIVIMELLTTGLLVTAFAFGGTVSLPLISTDDQLIVAAVAAAISLTLAIGLWFLKKWAWTGVMLYQGVVLASGLLGCIRGEEPFAQLALGILIVFYLNQAEVQAAFRRQPANGSEQMA
jgi:hypothetical protein